LELGLLVLGWLALGQGLGLFGGYLILDFARNPSLKQQLLSYVILGFALSEAMGFFCLMVVFLILFAM
jgi:F-type H+-transporting ATPase subunit c